MLLNVNDALGRFDRQGSTGDRLEPGLQVAQQQVGLDLKNTMPGIDESTISGSVSILDHR